MLKFYSFDCFDCLPTESKTQRFINEKKSTFLSMNLFQFFINV